MFITQEKLKCSLNIMSNLGISVMHKQYLIDSLNDKKFEHFISLVDELSSKAFWLADASTPEKMKMRIEDHLEARKKLIDKFKECIKNGVVS